ncbi:MAG: tRNA (N6-threonylcarbamoyladenosine(37)-N6)-methyltransferase TrmO [Bdellovibrio sp.]|nr:tRNA (N6-threonylcarbamoyladenosine(37)-N6)-methyltransferase TrmO [Bdellovibrio sp.]
MSSEQSFTFIPIGYLKSCYPDKFGVPRQPGLVKKAYSELQIRADLQPEISLQGLEGYSHVWLQFIFHLNNSVRFHAKVHPPRLGGETMGLFATRSPHRPNPIGLSLVELVEIKNDTLIFAGADLVEGTPILDIKPYLPHIESVPQAKNGWLAKVQLEPIQVTFTDSALEILQNWMSRTQKNELKEVIIDTLKQDPRPVIYKGYEAGQSPYRNKHAFRLYDGDIHFEFISATEASVFAIHF